MKHSWSYFMLFFGDSIMLIPCSPSNLRFMDIFFSHNYFINVFRCFHLQLSFDINFVGKRLCGDDYLPMKAKMFAKMENTYSLQAIKFA